MTPLLNVESLAVSFRVAGPLVRLVRPNAMTRLSVIEDVSFDVGRGETMGLVGESGSGKTTLARAIMGLIPIAQGSIASTDASSERRATSGASGGRSR
jgi:ABC-type glutathione transport system ATPase component